MKKIIFASLLFAASGALLTSCNDFLDITPTGKVIAKTADEYRALLTYEYKYFPSDRGLITLRSDEMNISDAYTSELDRDTYLDLWRWNDDAPATTTTYTNWRGYYHAIYISNYIIAHKDEITDGTQAEINQLVGESYMMRAYAHFTLVNLYAKPYTSADPAKLRGVPVMLEADVNAIPRSSSVKAVYEQVLSDISEAEKYLNVEKWDAGYNYRFNTVSAQALRARTNLYMGNWQEALTASKAVITARPELEDMTTAGYTIPSRFDSKESIVALDKVMTAQTVAIGRPSTAFIRKYRSGDARRTGFYRRVTASITNLLKGGNDDFNVTFRTSEFYLSAAEAAMNLGQRTEALDFLKTLIHNRYSTMAEGIYVPVLEAMTDDELKEEIINERSRELAFEGHRWFDMRRTTMPSVSKTYNGESYTLGEGDERYTLRFPTEAVEANPEIELWN